MMDPDMTAGDVYAQRARAVTKQPTGIDWGYGDEGPMEMAQLDQQEVTRGESFSDLISFLVYSALRVGTVMQLFSLLLMMVVYHGHGGTNSFTFDLYNFRDSLRTSPVFIFTMITLLLAYAGGCLLILGFHTFVADNGKLARGYRAGSKMLSTAVTLDLLVTGLRLLQFIYGFHFMTERWWLRYLQTKPDFSLFQVGSMMHGFTLLLYGLSVFYMEGFHDEGTFEEWAWICLGLFGLAGLSEIMMVLTNWGAWFIFLQVAAMICFVIWGFSFEPLLHYHSPALHDRHVNDDVVQATGEESYVQ